MDVSLPADPKTSKYYQGTHGDTDYYFFETPDLPLFAPLLNDKIGVGNFNGNTFNLASGNTIKLDVLNGALSDNVLNSGGCLRVDGHLAPRGTWRALTGQGIKVGFTRGPVA